MNNSKSQAPGPRLLSLQEAAIYLGLTIRSVHRLIAQGKLRPVRLGGFRRTLLDRTDLEALVAMAKQRAERLPKSSRKS